MTTNSEYLKELASRGDGSLQAWFDAEHDQYPKGHESLNGYEERLYDVKVSECPYCGRDRVVIHDFNNGYEEPDSYRVEHLDEKEACTAGCYEMYFSFSTVEDAVKHADMRGGYKNEHPKNLYVSAEDFEWLEENLRSEHVQKLDEFDSREKLEADVRKWCAMMGMQPYQLDFVYGWLDRQAAITEQTYEQRVSAIEGQVDRIKAENIALAHDLGECMADRDRYRSLLGHAIDNAHRTLTLVDSDGSVYDEGLA